MSMHEFEARIRHLEELFRASQEINRRLADQVGAMNQMMNMARQPPGTGTGTTAFASIAKNGASAIAAMTGGTTPGSGTVTLYDGSATTLSLSTAGTATAYNLHPTASVAANAWLKVIRMNGKWWVIWEPC